MKETLNLRNVSLMLSIIGVFILVGAELFSHLVIAATAFEAPPRSFAIFEGEYALGRSRFWWVIPPITFVLYVFTFALHWNTPRRRLILVSFVGFTLLFLVSALYIFPQYQEIISVGYSDEVIPELRQRAITWSILAYCRMTLTILVGMLLLMALARPLSGAKATTDEQNP